MATKEQNQAPTSVQVLAARLRVKADQRLERETPAEIKAIAAVEIQAVSPAKSA